MRRAAILAVLALASAAALAATVNVTWDNARTNVDGSTIPSAGEGAITATRVEWAPCGPGDTFGAKAGEAVVPGNVSSLVTPNLPPGRWCVRGIHVNGYGVESDPSGVAVRVIDAPKPRPPENFSLG